MKGSRFDNWTIVRPAITYSKRRFQLVSPEAGVVVYRALNKLPLILPKEAMPVHATMSWAGDVAKMMARLVLNPATHKETYTLATAEHHTWKEIAIYYKEIIGLDYKTVDTKTYLSLFGPNLRENGFDAKYKLIYDRYFNRVVDNSKILSATSLKQSDLTPLKIGLRKELSALTLDTIQCEHGINERMNGIIKTHFC